MSPVSGKKHATESHSEALKVVVFSLSESADTPRWTIATCNRFVHPHLTLFFAASSW